MKKTLKIFAFAVIALAALASCAKEQFKENTVPAGEKIQVSINGLIGELTPADATKATAGSVVRVTWEQGDKVFVYDGSDDPIGTLIVTPDEKNASYALLSGEITGSEASPSKLTLVYVKGETEAPAIAGGKISIDLSAQDQKDVPFVLYSTIDYDAAKLSKANEYISFSFATSVMTVNCTGLPTDEGTKIDITKAEIDGVSTACELTVTGSGVTVAGASTGKITRTETAEPSVFTQSDSRSSFILALAADPAAPAARNILVYQDSKVYGAPFTQTTLTGDNSYNTVYELGEYALSIPDGFVDLGVTTTDGKPLYWAKCNLGASNPWEYGKYFQWGDVTGQTSSAVWWTSTPFNGGKEQFDENEFNKVKDAACPDGVLANEYDAAYRVNSAWRMPTKEEFAELLKQCFLEWTGNYNGTSVQGLIVWKAQSGDAGWFKQTAAGQGRQIKNDGSEYKAAENHTFTNAYSIEIDSHVFFPAAGNASEYGIGSVSTTGFYWSSSLNLIDHNGAYLLLFGSSAYAKSGDSRVRAFGMPVRPVTNNAAPKPAVKVESVTLNKSEIAIEAGATETLVATVSPANATHKEVIWSSSKPSVATVDSNGEVTGVAAGSAVITATTADGNFTAVCIVTVIQGLPADALPGVFTVNADEKKVHFSKGNL